MRRVNFRRGKSLFQGLGLSVGSTDAHANGALSATQPVMRGGQDQVTLPAEGLHTFGRSERGVLCTRVIEDAEMRRSSLSRLVLMAKTVSSLDPIELVINPAGNAQRASHQASTTSEFAAVSVIDGRPDVLMANTGFTLDEKKACNNSFCNTGTPRQAEGAWKGEGTNWATKGSSDMRESMRNADKYGHVESSR